MMWPLAVFLHGQQIINSCLYAKRICIKGAPPAHTCFPVGVHFGDLGLLLFVFHIIVHLFQINYIMVLICIDFGVYFFDVF